MYVKPKVKNTDRIPSALNTLSKEKYECLQNQVSLK